MGKNREDGLRRYSKVLAGYVKLIVRLSGGNEAMMPLRDGFGKGLFNGGKMFGLSDEEGALLLKLPPSRVQELIAAKVGVPWHPGKGTPLKDWVAVKLKHSRRWLTLAEESRGYVGSKRK